jgi:hypothetical protein
MFTYNEKGNPSFKRIGVASIALSGAGGGAANKRYSTPQNVKEKKLNSN